MVKSVAKALELLDFVVEQHLERDGVGLSEIAAHLGEQATTVRNILKTMEDCGYIGRDGRLYTAGPKCGDLAFGTGAGRRLLDVAQPLLEALAKATGESLVLTTLMHGARKVLLRVGGGELINVNTSQLADDGGYGLVTTRVLLAFAPPARAQAAINRLGMPGAAWDGIISESELATTLAAIRECGHAQAVTSNGIVALAVPVVWNTEPGLAAIGMYLPEFRTNAKRRQDLLKQLQATAEQIQTALA